MRVVDAYDGPRGYYAFLPEEVPAGDTLPLVVFLHGYGALNPVTYAGWLRHLVDGGHAVVYPRYQRNLFVPGSRRFADHAAAAIRGATAVLAEADGLPPVATSDAVFIGHSYGGTIAATLLADSTKRGLPRASGLLLSAPGTSRLRGSRLDSYATLPPDLPVVLVTHARDHVTGDEFARLLDETAPPEALRLWIRHQRSGHAGDTLTSHHNEAYSPHVDPAFDSGLLNYTTRKALRVGTCDATDSLVYWRLADLLLSGPAGRRQLARLAERSEEGYAFGSWPDGHARQPLRMRPLDASPVAPDEPRSRHPRHSVPSAVTTRESTPAGRRAPR